MKVKLWASAHKPTPDQGADFEMLPEDIQSQLNNTPADPLELERIAHRLLAYAVERQADIYQPGGSPAFQFILGKISPQYGVHVFYAHSERMSVEKQKADGSVEKVSIFKHRGWIQVA